MARRAVLRGIGLSGAFGYDAWNHWVVPGPKFVFMHLYLPHSPWVVDGDGIVGDGRHVDGDGGVLDLEEGRSGSRHGTEVMSDEL